MLNRRFSIGICGTFDVENFGDLLFPLIAETELSRRLGDVELIKFSYHAKTPPDWPYAVTPVSRLPEAVSHLDGLLVGGGHLIRFDKHVADGYLPPETNIHHPTGYWLAPTLTALLGDCPVVWNSVGAVAIPHWSEPMMRLALAHSQYVAVRDRPTRDALAPFVRGREIAIVPDTGFGVARLVDKERPTAAFSALQERLGLTRPYIGIQATVAMAAFCRLVRAHPERFQQYQFVSLEIGPAIGDNTDLIAAELPNLIRLPRSLHPLLLAEIIAHAAGVVGVSLHLSIAAVAFGVPSFRPANTAGDKYAILGEFERVYHFDAKTIADPDWFIDRLNAVGPSAALGETVARLDAHWDKVAAAFTLDQRPATRMELATFWHALPTWLEAEVGRPHAQAEALNKRIAEQRDAAIAERDAAIAGRDAAIAGREAAIAGRDAAIAGRDAAIAGRDAEAAARGAQADSFRNSTSWKLTAPVRWIGRRSRRVLGNHPRNVLRFDMLRQQALAKEPYQWALADKLFSPHDAGTLAASFPRDRFKTVKGHDREKGYEYEARALIHLGDDGVSAAEGLSSAWRQLADDLLSPEYRTTMTHLIGQDLMTAPMEAYVCHYGPGAWLGPHLDLKDKIVTHVFYFNQDWNAKDGGCLNILQSANTADILSVIPPIVGNSSILVRSDNSWHSVSPVTEGCRQTRRSMNVIFYRQGAMSTMWPPGQEFPLHDYDGGDETAAPH